MLRIDVLYTATLITVNGVIPAKAGIQTPSLRRQGTILLNTGFPRIEYGAGSVKPGMTNLVRLMTSCIKPLIVTFLILFFLLPIGSAYSFETKGQDCAKCHTLGNDEAKDLLKGFFPDIKIVDIRVSPSKAFWEVFSESGGRKGLIYVDFSKKYLMLGSMVSIKEKKNLTQERFTELNKIDVSQIPLEDALVMGDQKAKIRIIAFDDPD
jgi:hypothetical protein